MRHEQYVRAIVISSTITTILCIPWSPNRDFDHAQLKGVDPEFGKNWLQLGEYPDLKVPAWHQIWTRGSAESTLFTVVFSGDIGAGLDFPEMQGAGFEPVITWWTVHEEPEFTTTTFHHPWSVGFAWAEPFTAVVSYDAQTDLDRAEIRRPGTGYPINFSTVQVTGEKRMTDHYLRPIAFVMSNPLDISERDDTKGRRAFAPIDRSRGLTLNPKLTTEGSFSGERTV